MKYGHFSALLPCALVVRLPCYDENESFIAICG